MDTKKLARAIVYVFTRIKNKIMEENVKKSRLARIPAWALSFITLIASVVLIIILNDPKSTSLDTIQIIGWIFNIFLVTVACFIICRTHPKSVWYTPVICNGVGILGIIATIFLTFAFTIAGQDYGTTSTEWIVVVSSVVFSVLAANVGARKGMRRIYLVK
jgi:hypothetical protein